MFDGLFDGYDERKGAMTHGWRALIYLFLNFGLGVTYFSLMITAYTAGFGLSLIWIGLPLLALTMSLTRRVAKFDRWLASKMLGMKLSAIPDDLEIRNANPLHIVGAHLTSGTTWQEATYLMMKFPLGITSLMMGMMVAPFLLLETLLMVIGINTGAISGKIVRAMASGLSGATGGLIPAGEAEQEVRYVRVPVAARDEHDLKAKRRLEAEPDYDDEYFVDDDGEIGVRRRS